MRTRFLIGFACCFSTAVAGASDSWTGVWRIVALQNDNSSVYHLAVAEKDEPSAQLYDEIGRPFPVREVQLNGSDLKLVAIFSHVKPVPLYFKATQEEGRLTGQWTFVHPQFQYGGKISGMRVMESSKWSPFEKLHEQEESSLIDIAGFLLEKAPRKDLGDFINFWRQEVQPIFYFFFQQQIYGDGQDKEREKRELARVFEWVRDSAGATSLVHDFPRLAREAVADLHREAGHGIDPGQQLVSSISPEPVSRLTLWSRPTIPEEGPRKCCSQRVVEQLEQDYLILNPLWFAAEQDWAGTLVKREIFLSGLGNEQGSNPGVTTRLLRPALALYLALASEGLEFPTLAETELSGARKELKRSLEKDSQPTVHKHFVSYPQADMFQCSICAVSSDLAGRLLSEHSLRALLNMNEPEVIRACGRALGSAEETSSEEEPEGIGKERRNPP